MAPVVKKPYQLLLILNFTIILLLTPKLEAQSRKDLSAAGYKIEHTNNEYIIKFKQLPFTNKQRERADRRDRSAEIILRKKQLKYLRKMGLKILHKFVIPNMLHVVQKNTDQKVRLKKIRRRFSKVIEYIEPNYTYTFPASEPVINEALFPETTALAEERRPQIHARTGGVSTIPLECQSPDLAFANWGLSPDGIDAYPAWQQTTGNSNVIVALVGTGVYMAHSDIAPSLWKDNPGTTYAFGETVHGYNANANAAPEDSAGITWPAGNIFAGIIAGRTNPNVPAIFPGYTACVTGVAPGAKIMPVKIYARSGQSMIYDVYDVIAGFNYVFKKKQAGHSVKIIHYPGPAATLTAKWQSFQDLLNQAAVRDILVVSDSGSWYSPTDITDPAGPPGAWAGYEFPLDYSSDALMIVGAHNGGLAPTHEYYSGYSKTRVDIHGPKSLTYGAAYPNSYVAFTPGSPIASAYAAGVAALIYSIEPNLTPLQVRNLIKQHARPSSSLTNYNAAGGALDAGRVIQALSPNIPTPTHTPTSTPTITPLPNPSPLATWAANYGTNKSNECVTVPGDHDGNGTVDGHDFLLIQRGVAPKQRDC